MLNRSIFLRLSYCFGFTWKPSLSAYSNRILKEYVVVAISSKVTISVFGRRTSIPKAPIIEVLVVSKMKTSRQLMYLM